MIIKFEKVPGLAGYFVFLFSVERVLCTSMPDDDFLVRNGWDKKEQNKSYFEIPADSEKLMFNLS
jgi:hypothetical protein